MTTDIVRHTIIMCDSKSGRYQVDGWLSADQ